MTCYLLVYFLSSYLWSTIVWLCFSRHKQTAPGFTSKRAEIPGFRCSNEHLQLKRGLNCAKKKPPFTLPRWWCRATSDIIEGALKLGFIDLTNMCLGGRMERLITGVLVWLWKMIKGFPASQRHNQPFVKCTSGVALRALLHFAGVSHRLRRSWLPTICYTLPTSTARHSVSTVVWD